MKNFIFLFLLLVSTLGYAQVTLPIDFETTPVTADFVDFDGGTATVIANPQSSGINTSASVAQIVRDGGQPWSGSKLILASNLDFTTNNSFSMKVFSPAAGIPVLFKLEGPGVAAPDNIVNTTVANEWETLTWNYTGAPSNTYNEVVFIFDFGTVGDGTASSTFLFDDVQFIDNSGGLAQVDLPITFEDAATVFYNLTDFEGGGPSSIVVDPTDPSNMVAQVIKGSTAGTSAGTTMGESGIATALPFTTDDTKMNVRVWSPDAGIQIRLKVEKAGDPTISVETTTTSSMAGEWETLEFDFSNEAVGTAPINIANTYNKVSIFFNFGVDGATAGEKTYYWDDVKFGAGGNSNQLTQVDLPITFEDPLTVDYALSDFGGNTSEIVVDPTDPNNLVGKAVKTDIAETWAGTTNGGNGIATALPFTADDTKMSVRVWSPDAGTPILLKVEDAANPAISVETLATTTAAGAWETLEFDFSNEAPGTAALNIANTYNKVSIFFNFGTDGPTAGEKTYFWDDVMFIGGGGGPILAQVDLPITFEDTMTVNYALGDFGGNASEIVTDPTDPNNLVTQATKTNIAETWAGTTAGANGLATAIPFTAADTKMTVRVWSPDAGVPILLKVENAADGAISVETIATTTAAATWETLEFDFTNEAMGTPALDLTKTYDKVSIFFNFGTDGATAGEKTYYFDDINFLGMTGIEILNAADAGIIISPNPANEFLNIEFTETFNESVNVLLFSADGRMVKTIKTADQITQLNVHDLNAGFYVLRIDTGEKSYFQKVMISK